MKFTFFHVQKVKYWSRTTFFKMRLNFSFFDPCSQVEISGTLKNMRKKVCVTHFWIYFWWTLLKSNKSLELFSQFETKDEAILPRMWSTWAKNRQNRKRFWWFLLFTCTHLLDQSFARAKFGGGEVSCAKVRKRLFSPLRGENGCYLPLLAFFKRKNAKHFLRFLLA